MLKKVVAIVIALTMIVSLNAFALTNSDITYNEAVIVGAGGGVEVVLTKTDTTLTASIDLVGPINNLNAFQVYLQTEKTVLTYESSAISSEFVGIKPSTWTNNEALNRATSGYVGYESAYSSVEGDIDYINIATGNRVELAVINYNIVNGATIDSDNYRDAISIADSWKGFTLLGFNLTDASEVNPTNNPDAFSFDASALSSFDISVNTPENGIAYLSTADESDLSSVTVKGNEEVTLNVTPAIGYYIDNVTENGESITGSFDDVYSGGKYEYKAVADAQYVVTFAKIQSATSQEQAAGMTHVAAQILPEVFQGKKSENDATDVAAAFGSIGTYEGKTFKEAGIYLTYQQGNTPVTTANAKVGPKFKADEISPSNQFGIIFEQLKPGAYYAQTYVEYTDETIYGIKIPFVVD